MIEVGVVSSLTHLYGSCKYLGLESVGGIQCSKCLTGICILSPSIQLLCLLGHFKLH